MKPFNLQEALSNQEKFGDPKVVIRDGTPMKEKFFHLPSLGTYCVFSVHPRQKMISSWSEAGKYWDSEAPHPYDLFMAPTKVTKWVNIRHDHDFSACHRLYDSEADAKEAIFNFGSASFKYSTHAITVEE